ncbi:hypothetical protein [Thiolapillus sp.]
MVHNLLFPTLLLLLSSALQAAPDWHECRQISTDNERLACYDNYVSGLDKGASTPDIKEQKSAFGLPKKTPADDLQNISSRIKKIEQTSRGTLIIYLDNQQVWRQLGSGSHPSLKQGDMVLIKRGVLGSFLLKKQNSNRSLRIKRIQ